MKISSGRTGESPPPVAAIAMPARRMNTQLLMKNSGSSQRLAGSSIRVIAWTSAIPAHASPTDRWE